MRLTIKGLKIYLTIKDLKYTVKKKKKQKQTKTKKKKNYKHYNIISEKAFLKR